MQILDQQHGQSLLLSTSMKSAFPCRARRLPLAPFQHFSESSFVTCKEIIWTHIYGFLWSHASSLSSKPDIDSIVYQHHRQKNQSFPVWCICTYSQHKIVIHILHLVARTKQIHPPGGWIKWIYPPGARAEWCPLTIPSVNTLQSSWICKRCFKHESSLLETKHGFWRG